MCLPSARALVAAQILLAMTAGGARCRASGGKNGMEMGWGRQAEATYAPPRMTLAELESGDSDRWNGRTFDSTTAGMKRAV